MVIIFYKQYQIKDSSTTSNNNTIWDLFSSFDLDRKYLGKKLKPELDSVVLASSRQAIIIKLPFLTSRVVSACRLNRVGLSTFEVVVKPKLEIC